MICESFVNSKIYRLISQSWKEYIKIVISLKQTEREVERKSKTKIKI